MYPRTLQKFDNFLVATVNKYANFRWYNSPITKEIKASKSEYLAIAETAKTEEFKLIDDFESKYNYKIDQAWYHNLALHTQIVKKKSKICYVHGRLLYTSLTHHIKKNNLQHINILETGTARGFSAICMAKAIDDAGINGKITTFDVLPHDTQMYWNCIDDHEGKKTRAELLLDYLHYTEKYIYFFQGSTKTMLPKIQTSRINFAFLDSAHDYYHLMAEFQSLRNKQIKGDVIFFDDYTPKIFPGVVKAIDEICEKYGYTKEVIIISDDRAYVIAEKL